MDRCLRWEGSRKEGKWGGSCFLLFPPVPGGSREKGEEGCSEQSDPISTLGCGSVPLCRLKVPDVEHVLRALLKWFQ